VSERLCIYYHWRDKPAAESLRNALELQAVGVELKSVTSGVDFPAHGITRCALLWSGHWTHTVLKFWLEKLDLLVGHPPSLPITITSLSSDAYGFVEYLTVCGAQATTGLTELATIHRNGNGLHVQPCERNEGLGRAVLNAISHKKGQAYVSAVSKLECILPWLPDLAAQPMNSRGEPS